MDGADRYRDVGSAQRCHHLIDRQAVGSQPGRVDPHLHLPGDGAAEVDAAYTVDPLKALLHDLLGHQREFALCLVLAQQGEGGHRLIILAAGTRNDRVFYVTRERSANLGKLVPYLLHRLGHVDFVAKLDPGQRSPFFGARQHAFDSGHRVGRVLDRLGDIVLDLLGRSTGVIHPDLNAGRADIRHWFDSEPVVGEQPEHGEADHHHRGEYRVVDGNACHPHERLLPGPSSTWTRYARARVPQPSLRR